MTASPDNKQSLKGLRTIIGEIVYRRPYEHLTADEIESLDNAYELFQSHILKAQIETAINELLAVQSHTVTMRGAEKLIPYLRDRITELRKGENHG